MSISRKLIEAASGSSGGGGGGGTYVDDVFSTYLYEGNGGTQTITNGIDLAGEGGLTWFKARDDSTFHVLMDTERGGTKWLNSASPNAEGDASGGWITFNQDGFTLPQAINGLNNTQSMASWTFRKAKNFFDVVTYEGDGVASGREIPHGLGCRAGMVIIKRIDASSDWVVQHIGNNQSAVANKANYVSHLNKTEGKAGAGTTISFDESYFNVVGQASGIADNRCTNLSGAQYVAYVFAHDESDESNIKCGNYTGNGAVQEIDLGWEPQFLLTKNVDAVEDWCLLDSLRGMTGVDDPILLANESNAEGKGAYVAATSTGFRLVNGTSSHNGSGQKYIYTAIRKPDNP